MSVNLLKINDTIFAPTSHSYTYTDSCDLTEKGVSRIHSDKEYNSHKKNLTLLSIIASLLFRESIESKIVTIINVPRYIYRRSVQIPTETQYATKPKLMNKIRQSVPHPAL